MKRTPTQESSRELAEAVFRDSELRHRFEVMVQETHNRVPVPDDFSWLPDPVPMSTLHELTFADVSRANFERCQRWHPGFPHDDSWSGADWSNAMCGEAGELANVVKKLRRIETGHDPNPLKPEQDEAWLKEALADECADVFLYLDLLASKYAVDLPAAIIRKFNAVSERQGFPDRLGSVGEDD